MLVSAERFRILENGYRASEALYESEEDLTKLASQLVVRDFAVNPLLYPVNPSCEILLKTKDPSSGFHSGSRLCTEKNNHYASCFSSPCLFLRQNTNIKIPAASVKIEINCDVDITLIVPLGSFRNISIRNLPTL